MSTENRSTVGLPEGATRDGEWVRWRNILGDEHRAKMATCHPWNDHREERRIVCQVELMRTGWCDCDCPEWAARYLLSMQDLEPVGLPEGATREGDVVTLGNGYIVTKDVDGFLIQDGPVLAHIIRISADIGQAIALLQQPSVRAPGSARIVAGEDEERPSCPSKAVYLDDDGNLRQEWVEEQLGYVFASEGLGPLPWGLSEDIARHMHNFDIPARWTSRDVADCILKMAIMWCVGGNRKAWRMGQRTLEWPPPVRTEPENPAPTDTRCLTPRGRATLRHYGYDDEHGRGDTGDIGVMMTGENTYVLHQGSAVLTTPTDRSTLMTTILGLAGALRKASAHERDPEEERANFQRFMAESEEDYTKLDYPRELLVDEVRELRDLLDASTGTPSPTTEAPTDTREMSIAIKPDGTRTVDVGGTTLLTEGEVVRIVSSALRTSTPSSEPSTWYEPEALAEPAPKEEPPTEPAGKRMLRDLAAATPDDYDPEDHIADITQEAEPSDEAHEAWSRWDAEREARGQIIPTYETWMAGWYAREAQVIYERRKAIEAEPAPKGEEGPRIDIGENGGIVVNGKPYLPPRNVCEVLFEAGRVLLAADWDGWLRRTPEAGDINYNTMKDAVRAAEPVLGSEWVPAARSIEGEEGPLELRRFMGEGGGDKKREVGYQAGLSRGRKDAAAEAQRASDWEAWARGVTGCKHIDKVQREIIGEMLDRGATKEPTAPTRWTSAERRAIREGAASASAVGMEDTADMLLDIVRRMVGEPSE